VPHPTTLAKLTRRVGEPLVGQLNSALLETARQAKMLRCHKVRADTTVVAANVAYPSDLGLLARAVGKLAATVGRVKAAGGATRTRVRDRRRAARRRARKVVRQLRARTGGAKQVVFQVTAQVADLAKQNMADAARVVRNAHRAMHRADRGSSGRLGRAVRELETTIARTQQLVRQARQRLAGQMPEGASRLVSLHDPDARPIRKGRIGHPVEFGYKAQVLDNPDGIVLDHQVMVGNPPDAPLLAPAVRRVIARTWNVPRAVTADRGYGEARVDQELADLGVARAAIPRRGRASPVRQLVERQRGFRRLVSGAPAARAGSAASSTASAGTAPGWTASKAPASGAATACSPTTSSRSAAAGRHITQGSMSTRTPGQATTATSSQRLIGLIAKRFSGASNLGLLAESSG
jgi:IS5 family transposase